MGFGPADQTPYIELMCDSRPACCMSYEPARTALILNLPVRRPYIIMHGQPGQSQTLTVPGTTAGLALNRLPSDCTVTAGTCTQQCTAHCITARSDSKFAWHTMLLLGWFLPRDIHNAYCRGTTKRCTTLRSRDLKIQCSGEHSTGRHGLQLLISLVTVATSSGVHSPPQPHAKSKNTYHIKIDMRRPSLRNSHTGIVYRSSRLHKHRTAHMARCARKKTWACVQGSNNPHPTSQAGGHHRCCDH
jgi:hypothetical protein